MKNTGRKIHMRGEAGGRARFLMRHFLVVEVRDARPLVR